jgi:hypothetical protein
MHNINDAIHDWHDSPPGAMPLHEFLGLTWEQYKSWVEGSMNEEELNDLGYYDD